MSATETRTERLRSAVLVLGCLTLADPADQGFSLLCAINVP